MNLTLTMALAASVLPADSAMWQVAAPAYENPAVKQWMLPASHSSIGPAYKWQRYSSAVDLQEGEGCDFWRLSAETYLKHGSSTLWGEARYDNGRQRSVKWNETSDRELIYPYITADSVGGDMRLERYSFAGGYADHSDRWAWGATISYDAGLYYRNVDPRPRNVTGMLDISVGGAYRISGPYHVGLSLVYAKYKQSASIEFKSQLGVEKIYHLTGLGTHYHRFAGVGTDAYYDGNRIGFTANVYPAAGSGWALTANFGRFEFDKVLTSLNKLPMAHVWHNDMTLQVAYMKPGTVHDWAIDARFEAYRRHGAENVFGDASSGVYPQIASIDSYADNSQRVTASAVWQFHPGVHSMLLCLKGSGSYGHRAEAYLEPRRRMAVDDFAALAEASVSVGFGGAWRCSLGVNGGVVVPHDATLELGGAASQEPSGLVGLETHRFTFASHTSRRCGARVSLQRQLRGSVGIVGSVAWSHTGYARGVDFNSLAASLSVYF